MSQISQIKKIYHAAIYVRLSKEDGAVASHEKTESNSIANQKSLIRDFLENKNDIEVVQEYVDDGFSGSNFERPAFQMMLEDIKKGKIDCVVTKDLSRFGREYIDSGMYIERLFPAMGVRLLQSMMVLIPERQSRSQMRLLFHSKILLMMLTVVIFQLRYVHILKLRESREM